MGVCWPGGFDALMGEDHNAKMIDKNGKKTLKFKNYIVIIPSSLFGVYKMFTIRMQKNLIMELLSDINHSIRMTA